MSEKRNFKPLHLAENIEQLEALIHRDTSRIQDSNKLIKSAEKVFHHGLKRAAEGDEEYAFVYFSRFMKLYNIIMNKLSPQRQHQVEQRLGAERNTSEKYIHELFNSLVERYKANNVLGNQNAIKVANDFTVDKNNVNNSNKSIDMSYPDGFISSYELYQLVNTCVDFVIFDARPKAEYDCSNMKLEQSCNIPEDIIRFGLSAHTLEKQLPENSKFIWSKRHNCAIIILTDWNSTRNTTLTKLTTLKDIITNWDPAYNDAVKIVVLDGGYLHWWESYPMLCTNSTNLHNERNELLSELIDLDQIEYPSTSSIKMKSTSDVPLPLPPSFDRSLKPSDYFKSSMSDSQIMENYKLHAKYQEYFDEVESMIEKRRHELEELRITQPDLLSQNDKISIDSGFSTMKSQSQSKTSNILDQVNIPGYKTENEEISKGQPTPTSNKNNKITSPETMRKLEGMRQQILLEARRKKKPTEEGDEGPQIKRQTMYSECMKTLDLQANLFGNRFNNIQYPLKNLRYPPVELTKRPKKLFIPGVSGLKNLGNTCFMNSIVQALSNTAPLSQYFINRDYGKLDMNHELSDGNFSSGLGECLSALWSLDSRDPYQPHRLKKITFSHIPHFVTGCHQDAHEFLIKLIEYLHDEMKRDVTPHRNTVYTPMQAAWLSHDKGKLSPLNDWFLGQMRVTMTCNRCRTTRSKYEAFYNLNVDLPVDGNVTLMRCIKNLYCPTILHGYKCPNCDNVNVTQRYQLAAYPPYLIISLNRFKLFDPVKFEYTKNKIACSYPPNLELSGFHYKLYAAVYHFGEMSGGHYIAICQNYADQKWYRFDDESYEQVSQSAAISETDAYLLFYQMVD